MPKDNEVDEKVTKGVVATVCLVPHLSYHFAGVELQLFGSYEPRIGDEFYSAATVAELRARVDALAEELRHANKGYVYELNRAAALEADAARYRFLRRKLCVTGNGDGTCAMQAINLPHRIHGWPEHGEHEQFFDAAIDSSLTGADPT